jgi:hypothetical protein
MENISVREARTEAKELGNSADSRRLICVHAACPLICVNLQENLKRLQVKILRTVVSRPVID